MKKVLYVVALSAILFSCKKDEETQEPTPSNPDTGYTHGVFAVNEGGFGLNNGGITYISSNGDVTEDLFFNVNGVGLGDIVQSFTVIGDKGYAVVNNSQKVEVFDMKTFQSTATISGLSYPRYIINVGNSKAYISNGSSAGEVKIVDLTTNTVTGTIAVGNGPEKMVSNGTHVFVCNSGGWDLDNSISVIEISSNTVVETIAVGDRPMDVALDGAGNVWVMCSGNNSWMTGGETAAYLYKINGSTWTVLGNDQIGSLGSHPTQIEANGNTIYYENSGVFSFPISGGELPGTEIISDARGSLNVNTSTGEIWCSSVSDFTNPSTVFKYNSTGSQIASYPSFVGTNAVVFN